MMPVKELELEPRLKTYVFWYVFLYLGFQFHYTRAFCFQRFHSISVPGPEGIGAALAGSGRVHSATKGFGVEENTVVGLPAPALFQGNASVLFIGTAVEKIQ